MNTPRRTSQISPERTRQISPERTSQISGYITSVGFKELRGMYKMLCLWGVLYLT